MNHSASKAEKMRAGLVRAMKSSPEPRVANQGRDPTQHESYGSYLNTSIDYSKNHDFWEGDSESDNLPQEQRFPASQKEATLTQSMMGNEQDEELMEEIEREILLENNQSATKSTDYSDEEWHSSSRTKQNLHSLKSALKKKNPESAYEKHTRKGGKKVYFNMKPKYLSGQEEEGSSQEVILPTVPKPTQQRRITRTREPLPSSLGNGERHAKTSVSRPTRPRSSNPQILIEDQSLQQEDNSMAELYTADTQQNCYSNKSVKRMHTESNYSQQPQFRKIEVKIKLMQNGSLNVKRIIRKIGGFGEKSANESEARYLAELRQPESATRARSKEPKKCVTLTENELKSFYKDQFIDFLEMELRRLSLLGQKN